MSKRPHNFKDRVGEKWTTNEKCNVEIVEYFTNQNCTIQFEDGFLLKRVCYASLTKGLVKKPLLRVGEIYVTNQGYTIEILEYFHSRNITIMFENGLIFKKIKYEAIVKGILENPYHPTLCNTGFIGVGRHMVSKGGASTKCYNTWNGMLRRCYNKNFHVKQPTYKDCTVDERWHNFQNFGDWFEENYKEGFELDKDILVKGNKIYSPETCDFVPQELNKLLQIYRGGVRDLPIGVIKMKSGRYTARITRYNKTCHLGTFNLISEASEAYKVAKELHVKELCELWKPLLSEQMYKKLIIYKVNSED